MARGRGPTGKVCIFLRAAGTCVCTTAMCSVCMYVVVHAHVCVRMGLWDEDTWAVLRPSLSARWPGLLGYPSSSCSGLLPLSAETVPRLCRTVPRPCGPCRTVPDRAKTVPDLAETVPDLAETVPECAKTGWTVPRPCQTVQRPCGPCRDRAGPCGRTAHPAWGN